MTPKTDPAVRRRSLAAVAAILLAAAFPAWAHFQVLMPSTDIVTEEGPRTVTLRLLFTHPMEQGPVMNMARPHRFGVLENGVRHDLLDRLRAAPVQGKSAYTCSWRFRRPGDYVFYVAPAPYWEPAENKMIIHYTKVIVDAFDAEEGWDALVGFPVEIRPLVRPYGLWTGNLFRGIVLHNGRPAPFARIEVEYWNADHAVHPPADPFVTQVITTDAAGNFEYAMPRAGWWGFAALLTGAKKMTAPNGRRVPVELGGLIWVRVVDMAGH